MAGVNGGGDGDGTQPCLVPLQPREDAMPEHIPAPAMIKAAGTKPKDIEELIPAAEKCTTPALEKCTTPEVR
jgi:hypothetical protein